MVERERERGQGKRKIKRQNILGHKFYDGSERTGIFRDRQVKENRKRSRN